MRNGRIRRQIQTYKTARANSRSKKEKSEVEFRKFILNSALKYFFGIARKNEQAVCIVVKREHQSIQTFFKTTYLYIFHLFFWFFLTTVKLSVTCNNVTMHLLNAHMLAIEK